MIVAGAASCDGTNEEQILDWQEETKDEILSRADATIDSTWENINLNEGLRELREYNNGKLVKCVVQNREEAILYSVQYAEDTNFALVHEYCTHGDMTYEGIEYKHRPYGLATWYHCETGNIMEQGIRHKFKKTGTWKKYYPDGSLQSEKVHKEEVKVKQFPKIN